MVQLSPGRRHSVQVEHPHWALNRLRGIQAPRHRGRRCRRVSTRVSEHNMALDVVRSGANYQMPDARCQMPDAGITAARQNEALIRVRGTDEPLRPHSRGCRPGWPGGRSSRRPSSRDGNAGGSAGRVAVESVEVSPTVAVLSPKQQYNNYIERLVDASRSLVVEIAPARSPTFPHFPPFCDDHCWRYGTEIPKPPATTSPADD